MTYTGDVTPGGPADVRVLPDVVVYKASVSEMDNNCYLLTCRESGEQLLIDAADDAPRLLALVAEARAVGGASGGDGLAAVATTHQHWDHVRALADVVARTGATTLAGVDDADALPVPVQQRLEHGDTVRFGEMTLTAVHLRGHTPGSIAYVLTSTDGSVHVFSGDSLFPGGVGNTQQDAGRFATLLDDVEARLFDVYPDETWVYPGHGRDTTLGAERPHLKEWRERGW